MNIRLSASFGLATSLFVATLLVALAPAAQAQDKAACDVEQVKKDMHVMMERDYRVRLVLAGDVKEAEAKKGGKLTMEELRPLIGPVMAGDKLNQDELERIVAACGWPARATLGAEQVRVAGRIMIHAGSDFTHKYFDQMWASYKAGETSPLRMATVIDDWLLEEGKLQRYGTRTADLATDGAANAVEDPEHLAERRRAFGIPLVNTLNDLD